MTEKFNAFENDSQGYTLTDTHGNELTIQNDTEQIAVYGQWQGLANANEIQTLEDVFSDIKSALSSLKSVPSTKGIQISKKKTEIAINVDIEISKDAQGLGKVEGFLQALETAKNKIYPAKP